MNNQAMFRFGYGLYVLTARENGIDNGCVINTAVQLTSTPNRILIAVNKQNKTHDMILTGKVFNLSMIAENASFDLFKHFGFQSGKNINKFAEYTACDRAANGVMYITQQTNAYVSGHVIQTLDMDTHTLFIAEVTDAEVLSDVPTVTYTYYQEYIKPKPEVSVKEGKTKWVCKVCGYVYEGEKLPDDFICPLCKHGAEDFEKVAG